MGIIGEVLRIIPIGVHHVNFNVMIPIIIPIRRKYDALTARGTTRETYHYGDR